MFLLLSFMCSKNIRGPSTVPWGTSDIRNIDVIRFNSTNYYSLHSVFDYPVMSPTSNIVTLKADFGGVWCQRPWQNPETAHLLA